ncbi:MAG: flagellar motor protein MotB [Polyangiaceae bacterium]
MPRKKKHPEHVNHERWLVSYADFMTLLFAFFVVMFASSQVDTQKVGRFTESFSKAVGIEVFPESGKSLLGGNSTKDATTIAGKGEASLPNELEELRAMMEQKSKKEELAGVQVLIRRNEIVLRLADNVVFASGTDEIQPAARSVLAHMADDLKTRKVDIRVEGHTDDKPIRTFRFRSNWDLSTSRATAVVADFANAGIEPSRLSAAGYAEFHPIATNASPEGRAQNRRVDVVVSAQLLDPATPTQPDAAEKSDVKSDEKVDSNAKDGGSDAPQKPEKQARNDVLPNRAAKGERKP